MPTRVNRVFLKEITRIPPFTTVFITKNVSLRLLCIHSFLFILQQCAMRIRNFIANMDALEMLINAGKSNAYHRNGSMTSELIVNEDLMSVSKVFSVLP